MPDDLPKHVIPGPVSDPEALSKSRPSLVDRVMAPRPATEFKIRAYRLRKAIESEDVDLIRKAARDMSSDERMKALEQFEQDDIRKSEIAKGYWNRETHRYDLQDDQPQPRSKGIAAVALGEGDVRETFRPSVGAVVNFDRDGMVLHGRILNWGKAGALVASPDGEFSVAWSSIRQGIAPFAKAEADRRAEKAAIRAWDAIMPESWSVDDRERFYASRGLRV